MSSNAKRRYWLNEPKDFVCRRKRERKTTQFLTLNEVFYIFDPNTLESIKGYDVEL